ncbi:MAG: isoleucine--tRNA ligase [Deltaproteobacteria bacterium]|nr:isoleucine--tRNA ligase [Deltaproteobacteria bacterium]
MSVFRPISSSISFPQEEHRILKIWKEGNIFQRSVEQRSDTDRFVFYDGPPFATGLPHYGHLVASTLKDIVPRYWTMRGKKVERRFGWDTHGLPIEMLMEKKLGLSGPTSIQAYGVDKFNEACRSNVLTFTQEWEQVVTRLGRWVDFDNDYKTMDPSFMESVWWVFSELWKKGLIYQDFRVMPFSWRLSTALSNFEANMDYRDVQDPAITAKMPLVDRDETLLIWTTTPWTLPSNLAVAVGAELDYVRAKKEGDDTIYIVAKERVKSVLGKKCTILSTLKGSELVGCRYQPLFDYFTTERPNAFVVIASDHVTTGDGTGLVHMAPDFGEDDFLACKAAGIQVLQSVDDEGNFKSSVRDFAGQNIKAADPAIIRMLKEHGRIFKQSTVQHSYPYCWRSGQPLIYKAVPALFVRVESIREKMVEHNDSIHWVPDAVGSRRFSNWLADARDWNISRNRFWGTPIPLWKCTSCEAEICVGSIAELEERVGQSVADIHPHKIDGLTFSCPHCGGDAKRISDVFDCWFESGSMPYAQDHYPFEKKDQFEANFPAQFIAEGLDQTRGWFYTLLVLSTALFDRPPFQNVIVNGMVLAEDGSKMSKSKQNYPPPQEVLEEFGADALRAYLINSPIVRAEPLRFQKSGVRDVVRSTLLPLVNAWSFFTQYANLDGWSPADLENAPSLEHRGELDRWLLSMLQSLVKEVNDQMEGDYLYNVIPHVLAFIDHLTNWYIRRSRKRFWSSNEDPIAQADKASAYATLYETLVTFSKILAPVLPFLSESMYQHLVVETGCASEDKTSVHLCDYPEVETIKIDVELEKEVALARQVVRMGRALREKHKLKTRQPLQSVTLVHHDIAVRTAFSNQSGLIAEELNVKEVRIEASDAELTEVHFKANFKRLGRRFGRNMKQAAAEIEKLGRDEWSVLQSGGSVQILEQDIVAEDLILRREAKNDVLIETEDALLVALDSELTPNLIAEGYVRDLIRMIQNERKEQDLQISDRIALQVRCSDAAVRAAVESHKEEIATQVLASSISVSDELTGLQGVDFAQGILAIQVTRVS